ncbi:CCR4-NOT transcription complex [Coprinopsis cinerea AmutBmut pab1-1]|nr:CCR4-NOT transcription complex [Coprinopsis cinerea AmutBmut pab1-1]
MAARKLQSEIDRTLKKVAEGVELFESIYEKMQASTNQTQKEKQEMDLKTQIKKLQRQRDQIKTWVASNDIKDKTILLENRRLIETQMEKFKACEKEMKTKAFSKEGLIQAAKLDPKEQEKEDAMQWLQQQVEELQMQVESTEAEVESLQSTGKKKNKAGANALGRLEELEHLNERRKWHISRLELVLRLLNNGSLTAEKVNSLKEDVQYFVSNNSDDDFEEDDGIYEELNLDEAEGEFGLVADDGDSSESEDASEPDVPPPKSSKKQQQQHDDDNTSHSKQHDSPILKKAGVSLAMRKHSVDTKPPPNINLSQQPMSSVLKSGLSQPAPRPTPPTLPPIRYAAAAAAAVNSHPPSSASAHPPSTAPVTPALAPAHASSASPAVPPSVAAVSQDQQSASSPSLTQQSAASPALSSAVSASQAPEGSSRSGQPSPALSKAIPTSGTKQALASPQRDTVNRKESVSVASPQVPKQAPASQPQVTSNEATQPPAASAAPATPAQQPPTTGPSPLPQQLGTPVLSPGVKVAEQQQVLQQQQQPPAQSFPSQPIGGQRPPSAAQVAPTSARPASAFPGSLSDLVVSFESVKQKAALRMNNMEQVHKMLEGGLINVPQPQDTDK